MNIRFFYIPLLFIIFSCGGIKRPIESVKHSYKIEPTGKVTYIYKSKERKYLIEKESFLLFNDEASVFVDSRGKDPMVEVMGDKGQDGYVQDKIGNLIFKDFENETINIRRIVIFQPYTTQESLPKFEWKITDQEKKIGKFQCKLAKTSFRGRDYNAWFTTEIPIFDGPWKFNGLPGLILEVIDSKKEYQFIYKSIEIPPKENEMIVFREDGINLPFNEFIKADDIEFQKLRKQTLASSDGEGNLTVTKPKHNPIELIFE